MKTTARLLAIGLAFQFSARLWPNQIIKIDLTKGEIHFSEPTTSGWLLQTDSGSTSLPAGQSSLQLPLSASGYGQLFFQGIEQSFVCWSQNVTTPPVSTALWQGNCLRPPAGSAAIFLPLQYRYTLLHNWAHYIFIPASPDQTEVAAAKTWTLATVSSAPWASQSFSVFDRYGSRQSFAGFDQLPDGLYFIRTASGQLYLFWKKS